MIRSKRKQQIKLVMKAFIFLFLTSVIAFHATAQGGRKPRGGRIQSAGVEKIDAAQVPEAVQGAFSNTNPGVEVTQWEKHNVRGNNGKDFTKYVASYQIDGARARARFKQDGSVLSMSRYLSAQNLPGSISSAANAKNPGFTLMGAEQLTTRKGETFYRVRMRKGASKLTTLYDSNGSEVSRDKQTEDLLLDEGDEG